MEKKEKRGERGKRREKRKMEEREEERGVAKDGKAQNELNSHPSREKRR